MRFPLPACLITILGLVSAGPINGITRRTIFFLNQKSPVSSFMSANLDGVHLHVDPPPKFNTFFNDESVVKGLGFSTTTIPTWDFFAQDDTYKGVIGPLPVYAAFKGGDKCQYIRQCLATVVDGSHGMITTSERLIVQVGNPAIVSFTNFGTMEASSEEIEHLVKDEQEYEQLVGLAQSKVNWLLNVKEVKSALGFTDRPKIVHVDKLPKGPIHQPKIRFQFYGGTKCSPMKLCTALIEHSAEPKPYGTLKGTITGFHGVHISASRQSQS